MPQGVHHHSIKAGVAGLTRIYSYGYPPEILQVFQPHCPSCMTSRMMGILIAQNQARNSFGMLNVPAADQTT